MKKFLALVMTAVLCLGLLGPACAANNSPEYNAVALMEITFKCGCSWTGMGTMVAENALLTASHNLVCYKHGSENKSVRFTSVTKAGTNTITDIPVILIIHTMRIS